jgi:hypothetical protein
MATNSKNGRRKDGHPVGYIPKNRIGKHAITLYFDDAEYESFTRRVQRDGSDKTHTARRLILDYAKRGLTPR